ncbi:bifunctional 5,10-methylenetetrahydrofolate dehydrogenase/5,10-methenyltetrahydrofolate cyclohydrolase [Nitrosopumilus sp. K4]|uniref:bifunctional 5,10-methylenetetrahydrofolate dehydrogenase/5,10-methenyltetrahydrofolate cyclohydrolase n=1 Tax=Nitrosopumilus sp. K4 TaxID=2795383 RepID=UPI001BA60E6F|nr:bifunctional 5,10-methylenetetrahydrofolate dehydrogenase/5,10-methenyltetrahydrofolate cyclohydrolase [Nitrosopumilus sp. K4]QUC65094.1 bifunctional 5,10-methylenetetrahydrofolate dehydrogenase/5,10-methenyltetrahydrofolate cyclohydrolase [Nitrosopumilus sp. K4]
MVGTKIDGKIIAQSVKDRVKGAVEQLKSQGITPCLATVLVGDNPASASYVKFKHRDCEEVGITTKDKRLPQTTTQKEIDELIDNLNADPKVHGILIQLPLPKQLDEFATITRILPIKDVDGLTPHNSGLLAMQKAALVACTPSGVMEMLDFHGIGVEGKTVIIINRSNLVGKPLYHLMLARNATVITCHSRTKNIKEMCQIGDIIVSAVGNRERFELTPDMIKEGAVVIDVATSQVDGKLVGDTDYDKIIQKASFASPVPGGVGPMTRAMLLKNTITACSLASQIGR